MSVDWILGYTRAQSEVFLGGFNFAGLGHKGVVGGGGKRLFGSTQKLEILGLWDGGPVAWVGRLISILR